jgi:hypothetical protein
LVWQALAAIDPIDESDQSNPLPADFMASKGGGGGGKKRKQRS